MSNQQGPALRKSLRWSDGLALSTNQCPFGSDAVDLSVPSTGDPAAPEVDPLTAKTHPLRELQNFEVDQWFTEVDKLALEFAERPVIQLGIKGQRSDDTFYSRLAGPNVTTSQKFVLPRLFGSLALYMPNTPEIFPRFHSHGFFSGLNGIHVGPCRLLDHAFEAGEDTMLSTHAGVDGRPHFLLQLVKPLLDIKTAKPMWMLQSYVDITDAVRECAIECASKPEADSTKAKDVKQRRNAVSELQMPAKHVDWLEPFRNRAAEKGEGAQTVSDSPYFPPLRSPSPSSALVSGRSRGSQVAFSVQAARKTSVQAHASLLKFVEEISGHYQTYFLLAPPTMALRSQPNPKYEFTQHNIIAVSPSLQVTPEPLSPRKVPTSHTHELTTINKVASSSKSIEPTSPKSPGVRTPHDLPPPSLSRVRHSSNAHSAPTPRSPQQHSRRFHSTSECLLPSPLSPQAYVPRASPPLVTAKLFKHTASSTLASVSASMAAGKPFRKYVMFNDPTRRHPMTRHHHHDHSRSSPQPPSDLQPATSRGLPKLPMSPSYVVLSEDEERSTGKWLYGVPMGDDRKGLVCNWVCWIVDSEINQDLLGVSGEGE